MSEKTINKQANLEKRLTDASIVDWIPLAGMLFYSARTFTGADPFKTNQDKYTLLLGFYHGAAAMTALGAFLRYFN